MKRGIKKLAVFSGAAIMPPDTLRQIAEKARYGTAYFLIGLTGIYAVSPGLRIKSLQYFLFATAYVLLLGLRESAYRLSLRDDQLKLSQRCLDASYLANAIVWLIFSSRVFQSEQILSSTTAATIITAAGLTAGAVTTLAPHFTLIRQFSALMMGGTGIMLPLLIDDHMNWYITPACFVYLAFLTRMGRLQSGIHWQLIETNRTLQQHSEKLAAAQTEALSGARAKAAFLANMSHEIRTPMNGVLGVAQLLEKTKLDDTQKAYLKIIRDAGGTLMAIIDDILDFSRLEAKKMSLALEPVDLNALVQELRALFAIQLNDSPVELRYQHSANLPAWVMADPARLRQLLYNLIGNAIKFTPQGSIVIALDFTPTDIPARGHVRFTVTDTGIGIAAEKRPMIFAKFEQLETSSSRKGAGLGLAICKSLVDLMGGTIDFESKLNTGSRFWFEIPVQIVEAPAATPKINTAEIAKIAGNVLLVEDNETNQLVAHGMLVHCGCNVHITSSGAEAIAAVQKNTYDLILMDCDMPGIDGFVATRMIRQWEIQQQRPRTPIIALTAHVLESDRQHCSDAGMDDYLAKPLRFELLQAMLRRWNSNSASAI